MASLTFTHNIDHNYEIEDADGAVSFLTSTAQMYVDSAIADRIVVARFGAYVIDHQILSRHFAIADIYDSVDQYLFETFKKLMTAKGRLRSPYAASTGLTGKFDFHFHGYSMLVDPRVRGHQIGNKLLHNVMYTFARPNSLWSMLPCPILDRKVTDPAAKKAAVSKLITYYNSLDFKKAGELLVRRMDQRLPRIDYDIPDEIEDVFANAEEDDPAWKTEFAMTDLMEFLPKNTPITGATA